MATNVALLAEGVDRNISRKTNSYDVTVALLAEGVDRNKLTKVTTGWGAVSPSSRRA